MAPPRLASKLEKNKSSAAEHDYSDGRGPEALLQVNGERSSVSDVGVDESVSAYLLAPEGISSPTFSSL